MPDADPFDAVLATAASVGISLAPTARERFAAYLEVLRLWRRRMSLITAATTEEIVRLHICDSLPVGRFVQRGARVVDIGSGAGFPGLPIAIAVSDCQVTLVESRRKRANFLREVVRRCRLTNVRVMEIRAEDLVAQEGSAFDVAVARALSSVPTFLALAAPLLRSGGWAIAMKGPRGLREAMAHDGFEPAAVTSYELGTAAGEIHRRILLAYRRT